ncbi:site-specific recombinase, phage integrase family [Mycobacterium parascrofulaceum ATCC BAA-614]|uniref:Site-specific recombinase, phage integrase family n=1 Tax=Mycobacterium parascrofulaceum ATCC BAA-614 TaxID=525368 RepID=D5P267_9MYCO|nr:site-specific recombinase, phage integrase family [Mycobacterium parascrofulaceum ATCC BAA-614]
MSTSALRPTGGVDADRGSVSDAGWLEWLSTRIDPAWRPGEWDAGVWLFTGDLDSERTAAWRCRSPGCPIPTRTYNGRCFGCRHALSASGVSEEEFDRHPRRRSTRLVAPGVCTVPGCECERDCRGLCRRHALDWRKAGGGPVQVFIASAQPLRRRASCVVAGCAREGVARHGLCKFHGIRLYRERGGARPSREELAAWIANEKPRIAGHQFYLADLPELVRLELLYALQRRDEAPPSLDPVQVRILISRLEGASSVRRADPEAVCESGGVQYNGTIKGLYRDLRRHLERAWTQYSGTDPYAGDVWHLELLDLQSNGSRRWPATKGTVDFGAVELGWLREVLKDWARSTRPYVQGLRQALRACQVGSQALVASGRADPASLGAGDFVFVEQAIAEHRRADGSLYSAKYRIQLLRVFDQVIEHGRTNALMSQVPDPFRPSQRRYRLIEETNEEQLGKALPEKVIRQLDQHLSLLGPTGPNGSMSAADLRAMHQTIYQILRDTGRRPGEIVSLKIGCVEVIDGQHNLIYDNHKAGRLRRRLPITAETADIITAWQQRRAQLLTAPSTRQWLFPSPLLRARQARGHLIASSIGVSFRYWTESIPNIDGELLGPDGTPLPFDRSLITPYVLRHSYAQRHADAGVPVDVLKELLDHRSITATMGYYKITYKRKQQAIRTVGSLAVDASGNPSSFADPLAYERASVSVPFGNCTEPSNVKAGGGACPIRFQCAGCGFYRPDPSYLPVIEEHIHSLKADRETARAMEAADYVIANMSSEIDAFTRVVDTLRRRLSELDPEQRAEIDDASRILRRARAARRIPITAVSTSGRQTG